MNFEKMKEAGINIGGEDEVLKAEAALEWVRSNTRLEFDINDPESVKALPSGVKLFVLKFIEITSLSAGVTSESIEGLSHSFDVSGGDKLIKEYAKAFLKDYLKPNIKFITGGQRWEDF